MTNQKHTRNKGILAMSCCKALCVVVQILLFDISWLILQDHYLLFSQTTLMLTLIYSIVLICLHRVYGSLNVDGTRIMDTCVSQMLSLFLSSALMILVFSVALKDFPNLLIMLATLMTQILLSTGWCLAAKRLSSRLLPAMDTLLLFENDIAVDALGNLDRENRRFHIVSKSNVKGCCSLTASLQQALLKAEAVFLCDVSAPLRSELLTFCVAHGIPAYVRPEISDVLISTAKHRNLFYLPMLVCDDSHRTLSYLALKRTMDIIASALGLLITSPFLLAVALAIKCDDRGPVFYRQKRLTADGKMFEILKFRSMRIDAEKDGVARLASTADDRITRIGHFIRATRLDELPQLINILRGEMSLVGPRPERPEIAEQYAKEIPEFPMRLLVKAGLTGYAQVYGKYNTTPQDKLQMDLMYIANMSLLQDIRLILQTIRIVLQKESAEGVVQGQSTAMSAHERSSNKKSA